MNEKTVTLYRHTFLADRTLGQLWHGSTLLCDTLEEKMDNDYRDKTIDTAIPPGTHQVIYNYWQKHGIVTPMLIGVPKYAGIRIHFGNNPTHTTGCILVGVIDANNCLYKSRITYNQVFTYMYNRGINCIVITHDKPPQTGSDIQP